MHPETPRTRTPNGLFSDETSRAPDDEGRTVKPVAPYRDSRDSLLAHRQSLAKELSAIDVRLDQLDAPAPTPPLSASERSLGLSDLSALLLPRRAMSVVMAGLLAGVGLSSLLAYELGVSWTVPRPEGRLAIHASRGIEPRPQDESAAEHALRRRKEGEALLMSSLFASREDAASKPPPRITRLARSLWEVDESLLDGSPHTSMRMVPHLAGDGHIDGIRIFGIRADGIPARLGLRNFDVVRRVNGIEVTGADDAFAALESVRRTRYLTLELVRDGELVTQNYLIVAR